MILAPPAAVAQASRAVAAPSAQMRHAAQDFEAMTLSALLQPMFDTDDSSAGMFGGGEAEKAWAPMFVQEIAKQMAGSGGLGLAGPVAAEMQRLEEKR